MSTVERELSRALDGAWTVNLDLDLSAAHKYIVFSDQHKGGNDGADEFRTCKETYLRALATYKNAGFTLILLGDVEELWEQGFRTVEKAHADVLRVEGSFPAERYLRIWGNHDDEWMSARSLRRKLSPYLPVSEVSEAIRFRVSDKEQPLGTLLLLHGHQGIPTADQMRGIARFFVRIYRYLQRWFGIGKQTPATDACLRGKQDTNMYNWASKQDKLVLIAGHTHRPVWSSRTHLQKLEAELADLRKRERNAQVELEIGRKLTEVEDRRKKSGSCEDTIKTIPCYFNTGCCKFEDGDITGIEIDNGEIRLVKWSGNPESGDRLILEESGLARIFQQLT